MKKLLACLIIMLPVIAFAQTDTTKVEQYCQMDIDGGPLFNNQVYVRIDYGNSVPKIRNPKRVKNDDGSAKIFNSLIDAMNYLGKQGWKLVTVFAEDPKGSRHYLFKKEFLRSALEDDK